MYVGICIYFITENDKKFLMTVTSRKTKQNGEDIYFTYYTFAYGFNVWTFICINF